jgi:hypothetical protein
LRIGQTIALICAALVAACGGESPPQQGFTPPDLGPRGGRLTLEPHGPIDFGSVPEGHRSFRRVEIGNSGDGPLTILEALPLKGTHWSFSVRPADDSPTASLPAVLLPGEVLPFDVVYRPTQRGPFTGHLLIRSDDRRRPETHLILSGESLESCVAVAPSRLVLPATPAGTASNRPVTISNCGNRVISVLGVALVKGGSEDFVVAAQPEGLASDCVGRPRMACEGDARLGPGAEAMVIIRYSPERRGAASAWLTIRTDVRASEEIDVALLGRGVIDQPPVAVCAIGAEGGPDPADHPDIDDPLVVRPGRDLLLVGSDSRDPVGRIVTHAWSVVERPEWSKKEIEPASEASDARFFPDVPGRYLFELVVTDDAGQLSEPPCRQAAQLVIPE